MAKKYKMIYLKILLITGAIQIIGFYLSFTRNPNSYNILDPFMLGISVKLPLDIYTAIALLVSLFLCIIMPMRSVENANDSNRIMLYLPTYWISIIYVLVYGLTITFGLVVLFIIGASADYRRRY